MKISGWFRNSICRTKRRTTTMSLGRSAPNGTQKASISIYLHDVNSSEKIVLDLDFDECKRLRSFLDGI